MATKSTRGPGLGLVAGVSIGILIAIVFKKLAIGILAGILIAYLLYRNDKSA